MKDFSNNKNKIEADIDIFMGELLKHIDIPIHRIDERFTTTLVKNIYKSDSKHDDASAAAIILQSYLDKQKML